MNKIATGMLAAMILTVSCRSCTGTRYQNNTPHLNKITLPDGSKINMKTGTTVLVGDGFGKSSRNLDFDGEAMFEVTTVSGKPFIIHTKALLIEVLGTRFRLYALPNQHGEEVDLLEGSLRVKKAYHSDIDYNPLVLKTGDRLMINTDIDLIQKDTMGPEETEKAEKFFNN